MIKKNFINIGLIGCGVVGLRRVKNLPNNFRLIGCADPIISVNNIFKKKNLFLTKNWKKLLKLNEMKLKTDYVIRSQPSLSNAYAAKLYDFYTPVV